MSLCVFPCPLRCGSSGSDTLRLSRVRGSLNYYIHLHAPAWLPGCHHLLAVEVQTGQAECQTSQTECIGPQCKHDACCTDRRLTR
eukprot:6347270-Amphidinium_carterae.1